MNLLHLTETTGQGSTAAVETALSQRTTRRPAAKVASASGGESSGAPTTGASDITSNDFLTLLVSELKNQDPTQPTDPNAYIQQLVGVNSLQQLIQINQGLTTIEAVGGTNTTSSTS